MTHVDALSRCRQVAMVEADDVDFRLQIAQSRDPQINKLKDKLEIENDISFQLKDGLVFRLQPDGKLALYVPKEMDTILLEFG